ncbi:TRAP transporter small permease subunit [Fulvimarina endophytica]|nr:TRAP transporter small permease [Fulvimarina endophytica]
MKVLSDVTAFAFGCVLVGLSLFVTADVVSRKLFAVSFEGADELGGYILAVGAGLAFVIALAERAHMRIDVLYVHLPLALRAALDWVALASLVAMALLLVFLGWQMLTESISYHSTAPTPWATPLAWPQSLWLASLALFLLVSLAWMAHATGLLLSGRLKEMNQRFGTSVEKDQLEAELSDIERRR